MKRSSKAVLALVGILAGLALVAPAAPAGAAVAKPPKAFVAMAAPSTSVWSQSVKLTASITPKGGGTPKGGTVTFLSDGVSVGTAVATTRNTVLTTTNLPVGTHTISAQYSGDAVTAPSTATTTATIEVLPAQTMVTLKATRNPVPNGERAELKATVNPLGPAVTTRRPTGSVTFSADGCISGTVNLNTNGVATWRPWLCPGTHTITAVYNGSERHAASDPSNQVLLTVRGPAGEDDEDVDQENPGPPGDFLTVADEGGGSAIAVAQTFVPSRSGVVYAVDLIATWFSFTDTAPTDLQVSIQPVGDDGLPTGAILGYGYLRAADVARENPDSYHIDLESSAGVDGGVTYALVAEASAPQTSDAFGIWLLASSSEDAYVAGDLYQRVDGDGWVLDNEIGADLMFRTHLSDPV